MRTWVPKLARGASGIAFGLLTWAVAHLTTLVAYAHIHPGFVIHYHHWAGPLGIAVLMLTVTSVVAVGAAALRSPATGRHRLRTGALTGTLAPAVFVVVELLEYAGGVHEAPPAALLVIGGLVHAVIGASSPALWSALLDTALRTVAAPRPQPARVRVVVARPVGRTWATGEVHSPWVGRAPPWGRGVLAAAW